MRDTKEPSQTPTPLWKRGDFIESRAIISWLLSRIPNFVTGMTLGSIDKLLDVLLGVMEYSERPRSLTSEQRTIRECIFTSLVLQGSSLPGEVTVLTILSRLSHLRVAGIRGAYWIVTTSFDTPAPTQPSPTIQTVSLGAVASLLPNFRGPSSWISSGPKGSHSAPTADPERPSR